MAPFMYSHNNHACFRINLVVSSQFLNTLQIDQTIKNHVERCSWTLVPDMHLSLWYLLKIKQVHSEFDEVMFVTANIHIFPSDVNCGDPLDVAIAQDYLSGRMSPKNWHSVKPWIYLNHFSSVLQHLRASSYTSEPNHCRLPGARITTVACLRW